VRRGRWQRQQKASPGSKNESAQAHQRRHAKRQTEKRGYQRRTLGEEYPTVRNFVEETQLRWYGHVRRMSTSRTAQRWMEWKPSTIRPRGRPRKRWIDNVNEAIENRGSTLKETNTRHCSWTRKHGETSSLTGRRPTSSAVQRYNVL